MILRSPTRLRPPLLWTLTSPSPYSALAARCGVVALYGRAGRFRSPRSAEPLAAGLRPFLSLSSGASECARRRSRFPLTGQRVGCPRQTWPIAPSGRRIEKGDSRAFQGQIFQTTWHLNPPAPAFHCVRASHLPHGECFTFHRPFLRQRFFLKLRRHSRRPRSTAATTPTHR
jgi:hypothetical protein